MHLEIKKTDGTYMDVTPYIAYGGVSHSVKPYSAKSVTTMSGKVYRGLIKDKETLTVKLISLTDLQTEELLTLTGQEYLTVRYYSPLSGMKVEKEMYVDSRSVDYDSLQPYALDNSTSIPFNSASTDRTTGIFRITCGFTVEQFPYKSVTNLNFTNDGIITTKGTTKSGKGKYTNFVLIPKGAKLDISNLTASTTNLSVAFYSAANESSFVKGAYGKGTDSENKFSYSYTADTDIYVRVACSTATIETVTAKVTESKTDSSNMTITYLNSSKATLSTCYSGTFNKYYHVSDKSVPYGAEYIKVTIPSSISSRVVVTAETQYWGNLSLALQER